MIKYKLSENIKQSKVTGSELRSTLDWVGRKGQVEVTLDLIPKMGRWNEPAKGKMKAEQSKGKMGQPNFNGAEDT